MKWVTESCIDSYLIFKLEVGIDIILSLRSQMTEFITSSSRLPFFRDGLPSLGEGGEVLLLLWVYMRSVSFAR